MAEFKDRLKELRKEKGLSQQGLADVLSKTKTAIHIGMGTADIRYRGEFKKWSVTLHMMFQAHSIA